MRAKKAADPWARGLSVAARIEDGVYAAMPLILLESLEILRDVVLRRAMPSWAPRTICGSAARRAAAASVLSPAVIASSTLRA